MVMKTFGYIVVHPETGFDRFTVFIPVIVLFIKRAARPATRALDTKVIIGLLRQFALASRAFDEALRQDDTGGNAALVHFHHRRIIIRLNVVELGSTGSGAVSYGFRIRFHFVATTAAPGVRPRSGWFGSRGFFAATPARSARSGLARLPAGRLRTGRFLRGLENAATVRHA